MLQLKGHVYLFSCSYFVWGFGERPKAQREWSFENANIRNANVELAHWFCMSLTFVGEKWPSQVFVFRLHQAVIRLEEKQKTGSKRTLNQWGLRDMYNMKGWDKGASIYIRTFNFSSSFSAHFFLHRCTRLHANESKLHL